MIQGDLRLFGGPLQPSGAGGFEGGQGAREPEEEIQRCIWVQVTYICSEFPSSPAGDEAWRGSWALGRRKRRYNGIRYDVLYLITVGFMGLTYVRRSPPSRRLGGAGVRSGAGRGGPRYEPRSSRGSPAHAPSTCASGSYWESGRDSPPFEQDSDTTPGHDSWTRHGKL